MFDLDRWYEIWITISHNKSRSFLTAFGVFWGMFMLVVMIGAGNGLSNGINSQIEGFASNSAFFSADQTSLPYKGFQKGRLIGYPTANLELLAPYVLPLNGVYKTIAYLNGFPYLAITNVGVHPTLNKLENPIIETHLLNYDKDTYEEVIELEFLSFLREEKTFNSLKELKEQISLDLKNF